MLCLLNLIARQRRDALYKNPGPSGTGAFFRLLSLAATGSPEITGPLRFLKVIRQPRELSRPESSGKKTIRFYCSSSFVADPFFSPSRRSLNRGLIGFHTTWTMNTSA